MVSHGILFFASNSITHSHTSEHYLDAAHSSVLSALVLAFPSMMDSHRALVKFFKGPSESVVYDNESSATRNGSWAFFSVDIIELIQVQRECHELDYFQVHSYPLSLISLFKLY